jgi:LPXTG-motif cell wall-anchored protein
MKKLGLCAVAVAAMSVGGLAAPVSASASAAQPAVYPPIPTFSITLSGSSFPPGASITVTISGCTPGSVVTITLGTQVVTVTCSGPAGAFRMPTVAGAPSATATVTAPTAPGTYTMTATDEATGRTASVTFTVAAAAPSGGLPTTGSDSNRTTQIAVSAVAVGAGLAFVARRRRVHARRVTA